MDEISELLRHERARLLAVRELLVGKTEEPKPEAKQKPPPPTLEKTTAEPCPQPSDELKHIHQQKSNAFSEMNRLHAQLQLLPTDEARRMAALRILELDQLIQSYWEQIHHYEEHGQLPKRKLMRGEPDFEHDSQATLLKKRNNARSYISNAAAKNYPAEKVEYRRIWIEQINEFLKQ